MTKTAFALIPALAAALVLAGGIARGADDDGSDHAHRSHSFVRISSSSLQPETQQIRSSDALGWVNYSRHIARVSFDAEVARHLVCTSRGNFRITGERLESGNIQARQFASLCQLAPGEYEYRVELRSGIGASGTGPERTLTGRLVVQP